MAHALAAARADIDGTPDSIDIARISKTFSVDGKAFEALRDITLFIRSGEFVSIVGPSGCGKSTLLRLVAGLDTADAGEIRLGGRIVKRPGLDRGMVFQDHRLFPWLNVERNILLGLRNVLLTDLQKKRVVADLIKLVGLSGFEAAHPHQLSGGMSQRAAIARALAPRPAVLLLDEPFGALDSLTRTHLQAELLRILTHEKITMLMVTHDVEEAVFLSDRIVVFEPRPGQIRGSVAVRENRPRRRNDPNFISLKEDVLGLLGSHATGE
jgi:sulfonate transport system ATP-binding protein